MLESEDLKPEKSDGQQSRSQNTEGSIERQSAQPISSRSFENFHVTSDLLQEPLSVGMFQSVVFVFVLSFQISFLPKTSMKTSVTADENNTLRLVTNFQWSLYRSHSFSIFIGFNHTQSALKYLQGDVFYSEMNCVVEIKLH